MEVDIEFSAAIAGIPCLIRITEFDPGTPASGASGPPELYDPGDGGDIMWEVLDRKGYRAKWLERKMTPLDRRQLDALAWQAAEAHYQP